MTEKKVTTAAASKKAAPAKKTTACKKTSVKKPALVVNAESVGFRAGDVYQALAAAEKPLAVAEIAKAAGISTEDTILGLGWLFKEGKIKDEDNKVALA